MDTIQRVAVQLQQESIPHVATATSIEVEPRTAEGFTVGLYAVKSGYNVALDGWYWHYEEEEHALNCFMLGLSDQCRLRIDQKGSYPYRWTLEVRHENEWVKDGTTFLLFFPFWRRRQTIYRQNRALRQANPQG